MKQLLFNIVLRGDGDTTELMRHYIIVYQDFSHASYVGLAKGPFYVVILQKQS